MSCVDARRHDESRSLCQLLLTFSLSDGHLRVLFHCAGPIVLCCDCSRCSTSSCYLTSWVCLLCDLHKQVHQCVHTKLNLPRTGTYDW